MEAPSRQAGRHMRSTESWTTASEMAKSVGLRPSARKRFTNAIQEDE
jgi:hypothetical protein